MTVGTWHVPVPYLQSLDGLAPAAFGPLCLWLWARMKRRGAEPDEFGKLAVGVGLFGLATALLAAGPAIAGADGRASILLPVLFHVISNFGAVWFAPVMLAVFATRAPESWRGSLIGINSLAISTGSLISGRMGSLYEQVSPPTFWLINAVICFAAAAWLLAARGLYRRLLHRENAEDNAPLVPKVDAEPNPA